MSRWIPKVEDVDEITNSGGALIVKAGQKCQERLNRRILRRLRDKIGVVGFVTEDFVLVAKSYVYGWIVSCHQGIVEMAQEQGLDVVMYIEKSDTFYKFDADDIMQNGTTNERGGVTMLNFDVKSGTNMEQIVDESKGEEQSQKENQMKLI